MSENMPYMQYTSSPTGAGIATGGPSRMWYWLGGGVILAGLLATVLWVVLGLGALSDDIDGYQRVPFGGSGEVSFTEPGSYVIYYEDGHDAFPGFDAVIEPLDGGQAEPPADYNGELTYNLGGHAGRAVGTIRILQPGRFMFHSTTSPGAGGQLALGPSIGRRLVLLVVGGLALGFASGILGVTTLIVTAVKRRNARNRRRPAGRGTDQPIPLHP